jgi:hypothetical protein
MMDIIGGIFWFIGAILSIGAFFIAIILFLALAVVIAIPALFMFIGTYFIAKS